MKNILLYFLLILFFSIEIVPQEEVYPYISELKGIKDNEGQTNLLYRIYSRKANLPQFESINNDIYKLVPRTSIDTLFLQDSQFWGVFYEWGRSVTSYDFWNSDLSKYIYCGGMVSIEPWFYVSRYDTTYYGDDWMTVYERIKISRQDDSIVYCSSPLKKSTDGGLNWSIVSDSLRFLSLSPFDDQVIFASAHEYPGRSFLYKTTDGGSTFYQVDTSISGYKFYDDEFYYDINGTHIYSHDGSSLKRSADEGNAYTWENIYTGEKQVYFSLDESRTGELYVAEGKKIFYSSDYGSSFNLYKEFEKDITGIYKEQDTDILYVSTRYRIFAVNDTSETVIKSLAYPAEYLRLYPLEIGNRWVYDYVHEDFPYMEYHGIFSRAVDFDTTMPNGKSYFGIIEAYGRDLADTVYERIDLEEGKVYRYQEYIPGSEYLLEDLIMEVNDTSEACRFDYYIGHPPTVLIERENAKWWGYEGKENTYFSINLLTVHYRLFSQVGLTYFELYNDSGTRTFTLRGMLKHTVVFGDTTLTGIEDEEVITEDYVLYQNYPNPFNPGTTISYNLPNENIVKLIIYDLLGNEIAVLVNERQSSGNHKIEFDASKLSSGVYIYKLQAGDFVQAKKMVLMK